MKDQKAFRAMMDKLQDEYPILERQNEETLIYPEAFMCQIIPDNEGVFFVHYSVLYPGPNNDRKRRWTHQKNLYDAEILYQHVKDAIADFLR